VIRIACASCEEWFRLCPVCATCDQLTAALGLVIAAFLNGTFPDGRRAPEEVFEALRQVGEGLIALVEATGGRKVHATTGPTVGPDGRWRYEHAA
jgi:hypothetical protein